MLKRFAASTAVLSSLLFSLGVVACTGQKTPNIKVQFINSSVGWIIGPRLLQTTDGGRTWSVIRSEGFGTFQAESIGYGHRSIQFIDSAKGVQLGGNLIAKTTDGGRTWGEQLSIPKPAGQDIPPQSLFFVSPEAGWVVGEYVFQTVDGGRSWASLSRTPIGDHQRQRGMGIAPTFANYMPAIWFSDSNNGLMARLDGEVYSTKDGGKTWEMIFRVDRKITDIFFVNKQDGWIVGDRGFVARTADGGRTWSPVSTPTTADLTSVFFLNKQLGWATGSQGSVLYTKNGGGTWNAASVNGLSGSPPIASVSFADESHGWAVGGNSDPMHPSLCTL